MSSKDEIDKIRQSEQRRGARRPASEESLLLKKRLERNADRLLELDLDEFLRALKEDYKLSDFQLAKVRAAWLESRGR